MKRPERLCRTARCFETRKMACGNARLGLRKAVKLSQATKDGQAMDFLEACALYGLLEVTAIKLRCLVAA